MTNKQFEQIECVSKKLWEDINNGHEYSMVTYTEFLGIVTEVWERLQEEPVNEDLEEEVDNYVKINGYDGLDSIEEVKYIANHFAKWQKTKDESTTEDLGEYINELSKQFPEVSFAKLSRIAVRVAKWQKENLWKHADDDDLPIIDREVIALLDNGKVVFAHRPPEYWDGKNIITGKVTRNYPKTYDKGGWNIPDVKYWLDYDINELLCREK